MRAGGDRDEEFTAFVAASEERLQRYGYVLTGSLSEAEELVQETLVRVYLAWDRIKLDGAPLSYTRTAMARTHVSRWRSLTRRNALEDRVTVDRAMLPDDPDWESRSLERDQMWQLLATLPPRQRAVVVLRFYEDLPLYRVAEILQCSAGTVRSHLSRALASLRTQPDALQLVSELAYSKDSR